MELELEYRIRRARVAARRMGCRLTKGRGRQADRYWLTDAVTNAGITDADGESLDQIENRLRDSLPLSHGTPARILAG